MQTPLCPDYFDLSKEETPKYLTAREINEDVFNTSALHLRMLAMDFPDGTTTTHRKELDRQWKNTLPKLDKVKVLWVRYLCNDEFLEAICEMKNLEWLYFEQSAISDLQPLIKLKKLKRLELRSSKLKDISPLVDLKNLEVLGIEASFNITNYEIVGQMENLIALKLSGNSFGPKKLKLKSLQPFTGLQKLRHLDLSATLVEDKSYAAVLLLKNLQRLDAINGITRTMADEIKSKHQSLSAGTIFTWNFGGKNFDITNVEGADGSPPAAYKITIHKA